jgi:arylsulfatase A-like enzyme
VATPEQARGEQEAQPPSIVLITIDTLRRDHLSFYGYNRKTTPGLERLRNELVVFEHAVSTSSWTKPSTASLMTGLYPGEHGGFANFKVRDDVPMLAEAFAAAGYQTAAFSGNPLVSERIGLERGFQHFEFMGGLQPKDYADILQILDRARSWLAANSASPFFIYIHLMNVHGPYRAPESYKDRFVDGPTVAFSFGSELWLDIARRRELGRRAEITEAHLRDIKGAYDGSIAYTDAALGEFVQELRRDGLLDRSVLVMTSDHGEEFFDRGSFGHMRTLHTEMIDIPLLIRLPGGQGAGMRVSDPVSLIDVPPTLLELAGQLHAQPGKRFGRGRSLLPLLRADRVNRVAEAPRPIMAKLTQGILAGTMLQIWPYRMINMKGEPMPKLYRIDRDPEERVNRAGVERKVVERLLTVAREIEAVGGVHPGSRVEALEDEALRQQLKALGYLPDDPAPAPPTTE